MNAITIAGTVAAALIAIGTIVRLLLRHGLRFGRWLAAIIRLPTEVERLALVVGELADVVRILVDRIEPQPAPEHALEHL